MRITLQNTLKSKDFLNVAKYPTATFVVDEVSYVNDSARVRGDLTFLGVTKCISFLANVTVAGDTIFAKTEKIILDRTDFGNTTMSKEDAKSDKSFIVPNEVIISVFLSGTKEQ
jgi:polyisoprenoid-binding protein YceI